MSQNDDSFICCVFFALLPMSSENMPRYKCLWVAQSSVSISLLDFSSSVVQWFRLPCCYLSCSVWEKNLIKTEASQWWSQSLTFREQHWNKLYSSTKFGVCLGYIVQIWLRPKANMMTADENGHMWRWVKRLRSQRGLRRSRLSNCTPLHTPPPVLLSFAHRVTEAPERGAAVLKSSGNCWTQSQQFQHVWGKGSQTAFSNLCSSHTDDWRLEEQQNHPYVFFSSACTVLCDQHCNH